MTEPQRVITENARPDSVEVSRTSKGNFSYSVKIYGDTTDAKGEMALLKSIQAWVRELNKAYPAEVKNG